MLAQMCVCVWGGGGSRVLRHITAAVATHAGMCRAHPAAIVRVLVGYAAVTGSYQER